MEIVLNGSNRDNRSNAQTPSAPASNDISSNSENLRKLLPDPMPSIKDFKIQMEKIYLERLILLTAGDLNAILETSNLSRSHFYALLKRHGVDF